MYDRNRSRWKATGLAVQTGGSTSWYIDVRGALTSEKMSLDLCRHLPRRLAVGNVIVVVDRPLVLLSVIRKRWSTLVREVERQYSCTLDAKKKHALRLELDRIKSVRFAAMPSDKPHINAFFIDYDQIDIAPLCATIYLCVHLEIPQITTLLHHLQPNGLLVTYSSAGPEIYQHAARLTKTN